MNSDVRDGEAVLASYKTPSCYSYTVKASQSLGSDRAKKQFTSKVKDPLSFEIWIFRNGQPDSDDNLTRL